MTEHSTYVQTTIHGDFFASCRKCGCDGFPTRLSLSAAEEDARGHGKLEHVYERSWLVERSLEDQ